MIPKDNIDTSAAESAKVLRRNVAQVLENLDPPARSIREASHPLYGMTWARDILAMIGAGKSNRILAKIRNSALPISEYDRLASTMKLTRPSESPPPPSGKDGVLSPNAPDRVGDTSQQRFAKRKIAYVPNRGIPL